MCRKVIYPAVLIFLLSFVWAGIGFANAEYSNMSSVAGDYHVIDDFESYNDVNPNDAPWMTWIDGWGDSTNGAEVGYSCDIFDGCTVMEKEITHGGLQSLPYLYDNTTAGKSEAVRRLDMTDWSGFEQLRMWVTAGAQDNAAEPMYAIIDGFAVVYYDDTNIVLADEWTEVSFDLDAFEVNLSNVNTLGIGFGDGTPGGSGLAFIDDVRLYVHSEPMDYYVIDDFESYEENEPNTVYMTWIDGSEDNTNGARVDHPCLERVFTHGGSQSMPYIYDNTNKRVEKSEAIRNVDTTDWSGFEQLRWWVVARNPDNAVEPMYAILNGSAVVFYDDPYITITDRWTEASFDLDAFGVDLSNVDSVGIGFGGDGLPGGRGILLIDDVRLYTHSEPSEPGQRIPIHIEAWWPEPADGTRKVALDAILSWRSGIEAAQHDVYFGTDLDAVSFADKNSPEYKTTLDLGFESYDPEGLDWKTTYYWRIDEFNETEPESPWASEVWSFTTTDRPLPEAVDSPLTFTTGGNADWFHQLSTFYYDEDAAESGDIRDNQQSWLKTEVVGPGTISFYWKVSSERYCDLLAFFIDGERQDEISGLTDWEQNTYTVTGAGSHALEWRYYKDYSVSNNSDRGWVDKVEWVSSP